MGGQQRTNKKSFVFKSKNPIYDNYEAYAYAYVGGTLQHHNSIAPTPKYILACHVDIIPG